jgi:glycosyltransferase involved in cell wall biosynthesis
MTQPPHRPTAEDPDWDIVYIPLGAAAFGGAERSLLELASAQQARGRKVLVCYERTLESTDFVNQAHDRQLHIRQIDWAPEDDRQRIVRVAWALFRQLKPTLIHFNISWRPRMWLIPMLARLLTSARLIGTMRAIPDPYDRVPRRRYLGFIPGPRLWILPDLATGRTWANTLHLTVSVNRNDFPPRLTREFGFAPQKLRVIYNGVQIPEQLPTPDARRQAKEKLGFACNEFVVAYVGRLSEEKGIRFAIEALPACPSEVHLVIAGEGDLRPMLEQQVLEAGLSERVHFIGYTSNPHEVFSAADAVVVPSLWDEAFGRVVVEAMASGAVVIASAVGGMQEIFSDGDEGFYVPRADAPAIGQCICRLLQDSALRQKLSAAGRRLAENKYATQRVAEEYSQLYASLIPGMPATVGQ